MRPIWMSTHPSPRWPSAGRCRKSRRLGCGATVRLLRMPGCWSDARRSVLAGLCRGCLFCREPFQDLLRVSADRADVLKHPLGRRVLGHPLDHPLEADCLPQPRAARRASRETAAIAPTMIIAFLIVHTSFGESAGENGVHRRMHRCGKSAVLPEHARAAAVDHPNTVFASVAGSPVGAAAGAERSVQPDALDTRARRSR